MIERISRIVLAVEAGLILVPLTLLAMYGLFLLLLVGAFAVDSWFLVLLPLFALAALGCGWHLVLTFVRFGRVGLAALPLGLWIAPIAIAVISLLALFAVLSGSHIAQNGGLAFEMFLSGSPALVPLVHLATERWMRANFSLERTREG